MNKSYIFTLSKYYDDNEIKNVEPIIESFVDVFADDNGVASLKIRDDVTIVVKKSEGAVIHMVLDNADRFTALPKKLSMARDFLNTFVIKMAKAVDEATTKTKVVDAINKVETKAESDLLGYLRDTGNGCKDHTDYDSCVDCGKNLCRDCDDEEDTISLKELVGMVNKWLNKYM